MRKFKVRVEGTDFELFVEEEQKIPYIAMQYRQKDWREISLDRQRRSLRK